MTERKLGCSAGPEPPPHTAQLDAITNGSSPIRQCVHQLTGGDHCMQINVTSIS
jgi:hypothetical protein